MTTYKRLRTMLTKARLAYRGAKARARQRRFLSKSGPFPRGSADWLIQREIMYGGYVTNVPQEKISLMDTSKSGFLTGGDRMLAHGYAETYAKYLAPRLDSEEELTVAEIGIFRGTGLAVWCDLFEKARVIGLDIDLSNYMGNLEDLKKRGAFQKNQPAVYEFDQFQDNSTYLGKILQGRGLDIGIDDGCHSDESIVSTLRSVVPYLRARFVYFIEDNRSVHETIRGLYPEYAVENQGELTVLSRC